MRQTAQVLIRTDASIESVAEKVGVSVEIPLSRLETDLGIVYDWQDSRTYLILKKNWYEGEVDGLKFEDFPYVVEMTSAQLNAPERRAWMNEVAQPIFEKIKALNCYYLALVDDLEVKIAEASP